MGFFSWVIIGLLAVWFAKFFIPIGVSLIKTVLLGVAGAIIGGYISTLLGWGTVDDINLKSILIATLGTVVILFLYRLLIKK